MSKPRIVVVGSSNTDMTIVSERLPCAGETVMGGALLRAGGGKGANQAVAASRAGASVSFVGRTGDDAFGHAALEALRQEGIDTRFVVADREAPSGVALIMVDAAGENLISVAPGANARVCSDDVLAARDAIREAGAVLVQLEIPLDAVASALRLASESGAIGILNPAPAPQAGLNRRLLQDVAVLTPNRNEARCLLGVAREADEQEQARRLLDLGVGAVAITLGADGVCVCDSSRCERIPAAPAAPVDTVGAGDCFSGVLAVALAEGRSLADAARWAACAAALSTERKGAQPSMPTRLEIESKLREVRGA